MRKIVTQSLRPLRPYGNQALNPWGQFCPPPPSPPLIVVKLLPRCHFSVPLKHNRHDTFLACRNCGRDRTRVYLDDIVVTVVNCCQCVATRLSFMFPFGREHCSDDSNNTFTTVKAHTDLDLLQVSLSLSYRSTIVYITWRSTEGRSEKERLVNFGKSRFKTEPKMQDLLSFFSFNFFLYHLL
jgi:hypothetical protein